MSISKLKGINLSVNLQPRWPYYHLLEEIGCDCLTMNEHKFFTNGRGLVFKSNVGYYEHLLNPEGFESYDKSIRIKMSLKEVQGDHNIRTEMLAQILSTAIEFQMRFGN